MTLIEGLTCAGARPRALLTIPVDEVLPGDLIRNQGVAREIVEVSPSVVEWAIRILFSHVPGHGKGLTVPLFVPVKVWRWTNDG